MLAKLGLSTLLVTGLATNAVAADKVGLMFGSYGDADNPEEIKELVINITSDPDIVPLPKLILPAVAKLGWLQDKKDILAEYEAIGGATNFKAAAKEQADLVAKALQAQGIDAKGYTGFSGLAPFVDDAMEQMKKDGVNKIILNYQGAQYSSVSANIIFRNARRYLAKHPDWDVQVVAIKSFSDDKRYRDLVKSDIQSRLENDFSTLAPEDVCIFLPMHGVTMAWVEKGDQAYYQMLRFVEDIRNSFSISPVYYGFQNHDEIPWTKWTEPNTDTAIAEMVKESCSQVLINGRISFTIDSLETMYDHAIAEKEEVIARAADLGETKNVLVEAMYNSDPRFVSFLADINAEALEGKGDLAVLR